MIAVWPSRMVHRLKVVADVRAKKDADPAWFAALLERYPSPSNTCTYYLCAHCVVSVQSVCTQCDVTVQSLSSHCAVTMKYLYSQIVSVQ